MKAIYKYPIGITDGAQEIYMPQGAQILDAQMQRDQLTVWALVQQRELENPRLIEVFGTGHPIPEHGELHYISTVQDSRGLVWHVFERKSAQL